MVMRGICAGRTFRRNAGADLNVGLFHDHAGFNGPSSGAAILGVDHPFAISLGEPLDRDHTDAGLIVAAVTRAKSYAPSGLEITLASGRLYHDSNSLTRNCMSPDLYDSIPSRALMASVRPIILINAWRLSILTIQVWTIPNLEKRERR